MVWPILPLVVEGQLGGALAATASAVGICWATGASAWFGLLALPALGVASRVRRNFLGPRTKAGGRCTWDDHVARKNDAMEVAKRPGPLRMFKATTSNTFRPNQIDQRNEQQGRLNLSNFVHVLQVNVDELWCDIEASATFETFVAETLLLGVCPLVVPELRTITVGGAIVGIGIESSSFKHGFFHEGLLEADILVASGEVLTVRPEGEHADLFRALPNSLGSFGYLLRLRMRVQRAEPFVRLQKVWYNSTEELVAALAETCKSPDAAFVDAMVLGDQGGVVMRADFVPKIPPGLDVVRYGVWPPFYPSLLHESTEYLTTEDYLWRWDADWFWCTQIFPGLRFWIIRWLCGPEMLRSDVYKAFNDVVESKVVTPLGLNRNEELVIQDIEIPLEKSVEYIRKFQSVVPSDRIGKIKLQREGTKKAAPIWLCPVKGTSAPLMPMKPGDLYINFGFWDALSGPETKGGLTTAHINRELERMTTELGGRKTLYSTAFFSEDEFYKLYNGDEYKRIKARYDPSTRFRGWYTRLTRG